MSTSTIKTTKVKLSKEEIKRKNDLSKKIINNRIEQINDFEENIVCKIKNNEINQVETIKSVFDISDSAKSQLERGGNAFTKADLIAIIIALDSGKISLKDDLQKLRISDLNSIIRSIIYDTNRYMIAANNNILNMQIEKKEISKKQLKQNVSKESSNNTENQIVLHSK